MTRYPAPGRVKTRLVPALGADGAAELHSDLARHCVRRMHAAAIGSGSRLEVHATGAPGRAVREWLGRRVPVRAQVAGSLGDRLSAAAARALAAGAPAVVLVGSDAPDLGGDHVRAALGTLTQAHADAVLGPAVDGGYYLVALTADAAGRALPALFGTHVPWGTERVLDVTLGALGEAGLRVELLEPLADVDRPEDLPVWERVLSEQQRVRLEPRLSVIIPALNEQASIAEAVRSAREAGADEVIVADGGSTDDTATLAECAGARVLSVQRGRARQLNAGAALATGDVLLFLHADTRLPARAAVLVRDVLADPDVAIGSFLFAAGSPSDRTDRLITAFGAWRHALFRLPYGDQAAFVRTRDFADIGGFPELPTMEDYAFAQRLARLGRIGVAPAEARTSSRAWRDHGLVRTTLTNAAVIAGYRLGVAPERLAAVRARLASRQQLSR